MSRSMSTTAYRPVHILAAICLFAAVSWGLLAPNAFVVLRTMPLSPLTLMNDILIHLMAYTIAAYTGCMLFANGDLARTRLIAVLLAVHGTGTELLQAFIPQRTCSASDLMANLTGIAVGAVIAGRIRRSSARPVT